jgi:uncharacterized glyoxalase superfamily protein PhnB
VTTDPFDALHQPDVPVAPNPAFASALRRRLTDLLDLDPGATMSDTTSTLAPARADRHLRPYLIVDGAARAIEFYAEAFRAVVVGEAFVDADGRIGHAELDIAGAGFFLADEYPEYDTLGPQPGSGHSVSLHLEVDDADAVVASAAAAGATVERRVEDRGYGSRSGTVLDPFGHRWMIDAPLAEPLTPDEIRRRMAVEGFTLEAVDLGERQPRPE